MRPTPRAVVLLCGALASAAAAERFHSFALLTFAVGAAVLLAVSALQVLLGSVRTWGFTRSLSPSPAFVGDQVRVRLIGQATHWWSPSIVAEEDLGEKPQRLGFAAKRSKTSAGAAWLLPAGHRGLLVSGPSTLWRYDLVRLFRRRCGAADATSVIVRPQTVALSRRLLLRAADRERALHATERSDERGDLRPYMAGDDPRRVNWKATAKAGATGSDLIVSTEDWQRSDEDLRVLLSLDKLPPGANGFVVPSSPYDPTNADRELALAVTASIISALDGPGTCTLEIRQGTNVLHTSRLLRENLDALAMVERLEQPTAETSSATPIAHRFAHNELRPHFVVTGPGGRATGRVHLTCDTGVSARDARRPNTLVAPAGGSSGHRHGPALTVATLGALEQAMGA